MSHPGPVAAPAQPSASSQGGGASERLLEVYERLLARYGPQHWWPGDSPFEVIVGAILTQSAAWSNVEKAIANLKTAGLLNPAALREVSHAELARHVRSSGYYNSKASKLKAFAHYLGDRYDDDLGALLGRDAAMLRRELLGIYGIGEETADSIVLYAAGRPSFVIDAYTRRIGRRLGLHMASNRYEKWQRFFEGRLPRDRHMFNEYHALFVRLGKEACRKEPRCDRCCLRDICPTGRRNVAPARPVRQPRRQRSNSQP
ncbi:MAG: endonuclease [Chloroflexi bacterium]|nr:endonuclease [Chloroflexota bacterium]